MSHIVSLRVMIQRLEGLEDTNDVSDWENGFIKSMLRKSKQGLVTSHLTENEVAKIEELFSKHFAG